MEPSPQAPHAPAHAPGAPRPSWRLAAAVLALTAVGSAAWFVHSRGAAARAPESLFYDLRDRVLDGDGEAVWRAMLPRAREDYAAFVRKVARQDDPAAEHYRKLVGISKQDLLALSPQAILGREQLAIREEFFRGAAVHRVDRWDDATALLRITTRTGENRHWIVKRVDGAWRVDNFWPQVTGRGNFIPRPGEAPREGTVPVDGTVPAGK